LIRETHILASLGVPKGKEDDYVKGLITGYILDCIELCDPCGSFVTAASPLFSNDSGSLLLEKITFLPGKKIVSALGKSTQIAFFIGTCGEKVELLSKQLMNEGHLLEGLIVDMIGSEIAEEVAEIIHLEVERIYSKSGLGITNRYSPGYCGWPVSDQQKLFSLFGGEGCGVHLTSSSLMVPIKSVSGMIGIGEHVHKSPYACTTCNEEDCLYRNQKTTN